MLLLKEQQCQATAAPARFPHPRPPCPVLKPQNLQFLREPVLSRQTLASKTLPSSCRRVGPLHAAFQSLSPRSGKR